MKESLDHAIEQWLNTVTKASLSDRLAIPAFTDPDVPATLPEVMFPSESTESAFSGGKLDTTLSAAKTSFQSAAQAIAMAMAARESGDLKGAGNLLLTGAQELKNCESLLIGASRVDMSNRTPLANDAFKIGEMATALFNEADSLLTQASGARLVAIIDEPAVEYSESFAKEETPSEIDLDAIRGHEFFTKSAGIPELWSTGSQGDAGTMIHLHYFNANADFYVAELDEIAKTAWGYARAAGENKGKWVAFNLNDLATFGKNASTETELWKSGGPVERNESWTPTPAGSIPKIVIGQEG